MSVTPEAKDFSPLSNLSGFVTMYEDDIFKVQMDKNMALNLNWLHATCFKTLDAGACLPLCYTTFIGSCLT